MLTFASIFIDWGKQAWLRLWLKISSDTPAYSHSSGLVDFYITLTYSLSVNHKKVRQTYDKQFQGSDFFLFFIVPQSNTKRTISKSNKSELLKKLSYRICLFLRLAAKFSELSKKFRTSFDPNGLKNGPSKHFDKWVNSAPIFFWNELLPTTYSNYK